MSRLPNPLGQRCFQCFLLSVNTHVLRIFRFFFHFFSFCERTICVLADFASMLACLNGVCRQAKKQKQNCQVFHEMKYLTKRKNKRNRTFCFYRGPEIPCLRIIKKCASINTAVNNGNTKVCKL